MLCTLAALLCTLLCIALDTQAWRYHITSMRSVCRFYSSDPTLQAKSVEKLQHLDFLHILPGHGRRAHFRDAQDREEQIQFSLDNA